MCTLIERHTADTAVGWKVVVEKDGKNYSPAMGFCYDDYEEIPVITEQKQLVNFFRDTILDQSRDWCFSKEMVGRTAVFERRSSAEDLRNMIWEYQSEVKFVVVSIKQARVSKDVLVGEYIINGRIDKVYAGRKIEFLE